MCVWFNSILKTTFILFVIIDHIWATYLSGEYGCRCAKSHIFGFGGGILYLQTNSKLKHKHEYQWSSDKCDK